jgi:zinc protease
MILSNPNIAQRTHFRLGMLLVIIIMAMSGCSRGPVHLQPPSEVDLAPDPNMTTGRLSNGFQYVIYPNQVPKDRVSMHLYIKAGSLQEEAHEQGIAHFLEHMLFSGSTHFPPGELIKYFQKIGMQFGADANAHTGLDETVYDILLPAGDRENLEQGLLVMHDYATGALLLPSEIERERKVILAEKRTRDSARYRTFVEVWKFEFQNGRIAQRLPIGLEETIRAADRSTLKAFYDTWYRPDRMVLVMVGDVDPVLARDLIEQRFASLKARSPAKPEIDLGQIQHAGRQPFYHYEAEAGHTTLSVEVLEIKDAVPDSASQRRNRLLREIAGQIFQNRLDEMVCKVDTPCTQASVRSGVYLRQVHYADLSADSAPEKWKETLAFLEQMLRQSLRFGFTQAELDRAKKEYLAELEDDVRKAATRESKSLARQIIWHLNEERVFQSPAQRRGRLAPIIERITVEAVNAAFRDIWSPPHRLVLVTGNAALGSDRMTAEQEILSVMGESAAVAVRMPEARKQLVFPYLATPPNNWREGRREHIDDLEVVQIDFDNGVRLNAKQTDYSANEVLVNLSFGGGRFTEPPHQPGLAELSEAVINESGLGALAKHEIEEVLAGKNTRVGFTVREDRFVFQGHTIPSEIHLLFQLLYAHIQDQGYRPEAHKLALERIKQKHEALSNHVDGALQLKGMRFLAGGDPRFGFPAFEDVSRLTLADVRNWISPELETSPLEVSVVGDFDLATVINTAGQYLGGLAPRPGFGSMTAAHSPVFPQGQAIEIGVQTQIPNGLIVLAYPTEDFWDIHRTRRLSILAEVFSERLRVRIREKLGASYSPFAYNRSSRAYSGYGVFKSLIHVDPASAPLVVSEVKQIAEDLTQKVISEDELRRAVDPVVTSIKDLRRTNEYWLNSVLTASQRFPQQIEWSRNMMQDYASIKSQELHELAQTYLDNTRAATIIIKPGP